MHGRSAKDWLTAEGHYRSKSIQSLTRWKRVQQKSVTEDGTERSSSIATWQINNSSILPRFDNN